MLTNNFGTVSALYAFPGASLFFFTALGIVAIAVEILTPHIKHFILRGQCRVALTRDAIRQEGIRIRKGLYHGATRLAIFLEMKEDQRSEVESVDSIGSSGEESAVWNKLRDSKGSNVEHEQNTSQFDVEAWLLVANAERCFNNRQGEFGCIKYEDGERCILFCVIFFF